VWDAALVLVNYLVKQAEIGALNLSGKRVIELGAGTGAAQMLLCHSVCLPALGIRGMYACKECRLVCLHGYAYLLQDMGSVTARYFRWGEDTASKHTAEVAMVRSHRTSDSLLMFDLLLPLVLQAWWA
jgi:hypothetical protein